jgi:hypothetical protein
LALVAIVCSLAVARPASALSITLIDTFEDGTTQGWKANLLGQGVHPAPPANIPTGGPAGSGDNFLLITALGGGGNGSRLTALNDEQWAGNYLALGIAMIAMDVQNFSSNDLYLRLEFEDPAGGPPNNIAYSDDAILLPAGSDWTRIVFPIAPAFLKAGLGSVTAALSNTTILRLYHSQADNFPNPVFPIDPIVARLGVDNIQVVPEPATMMLLGGGIAALAVRRRFGPKRG